MAMVSVEIFQSVFRSCLWNSWTWVSIHLQVACQDDNSTEIGSQWEPVDREFTGVSWITDRITIYELLSQQFEREPPRVHGQFGRVAEGGFRGESFQRSPCICWEHGFFAVFQRGQQ